jgi:hypothetical protein
MCGRALRLMKHYFYQRFLRVVNSSSSSTRKQLFSSVPQGAKWSPFLWNFDISEMPEAVSSEADVICYADDSGLWYEITKGNKACIIGTINDDLQALVEWGKDNKTTFEASKNSAMVVSRKRKPFDISGARMSGLRMGGCPVEVVKEMRLVGFWFDNKLTFGGMVGRLAKKARSRVGALWRLKPMLNSENLKTMYKSFVRSVMEFGSLAYMSACDSHLEKLNRIQESVSSFCGFTIESLESRREAAAVAMAFKMLDGKTRGDLNHFKPEFGEPLSLNKKRTRSNFTEGPQIKSLVRASSLDSFKRSFLGRMPSIFKKLPIEMRNEGQDISWTRVKKRAKMFLTGKLKCLTKTNHKFYRKSSFDWEAMQREMKEKRISITNK